MSTHTWQDFTAFEEAGTAGDCVTREHVELPETGLAALLAWVAGPRHVFTVCDSDGPPHKTIVTVVDHKEGVVHRNEVARSEEDQEDIDRDIDEFLVCAGVPARPRGLRWFLKLPDSYATDAQLWDVVNAAIAALPSTKTAPADTRGALENARNSIFRD